MSKASARNAREDIDRAVQDRELADGPDQARLGAAAPLSASTISAAAAAASWRSAIGTVRHARPSCTAPRDRAARDRGHDPPGDCCEQHRSLLDMHFEIADADPRGARASAAMSSGLLPSSCKASAEADPC
jgi:hypothetical protein